MNDLDSVAEFQALRSQAKGADKTAAVEKDPVAEFKALRAQVAAQPPTAAAPAKTFQAEGPAPSLLSTFGNGVAKGVAGLADALPNAAVNLANLGIAGYGVAKHAITGSNDLPEPIPSDALSGYSKLGHLTGIIDDKKNPTDLPGRVVDAIGQVVGGGGVNPRSVVNSAGRVLVAPTSFRAYAPLARDIVAPVASGVGAAAGSEVTRGVDTGNTALDNAIKIGSTVAGGLIPGAIVSARGTAGDRAAAAMKGLTDEQIQQAQELVRKAAEQGSPITGYEAMQAVTGVNPKMQTQQRLAEQSDSAAKNLTPMMQDRPQNNAALMDNVTSGIAPTPGLPDTLAGTLQQAAQDSIDAARRGGNTLAAPYYAATSNNPAVKIPPHDWNALTSDPRVSAALEAVKSDPYSGLENATAGSAQWLDAAKKYLDSQSQAKALQGDNFAASNRSGAATAITDAMDPALPDYARARSIVAQNMRDNVVPMQNGQVGKLSNSNDFKQQSEALLPNAPADVTPAVVTQTAKTIGQQNPDILSQFLAQDLGRKYDEATQRNMGGENAFGGAKFAANVAGNPTQEQNLMAALHASNVDPVPFKEALDNFRAQGYKPNAGSATAANLNEGNSFQSFFSAPFQTAKAYTDAWTNGMALDDLSAALAAKQDSVNKLLNLSRESGNVTPMQNALISNFQSIPTVSGMTPVSAQQDQSTPARGIISSARNAAN